MRYGELAVSHRGAVSVAILRNASATFSAMATDSATDATADSTIGWAEGQAPSSINDSARAQMAVQAKWRDDISGAIVTGGTSTSYQSRRTPFSTALLTWAIS